ncbi:MAG: FapA family protein [Desulfuromonadales bacterium]
MSTEIENPVTTEGEIPITTVSEEQIAAVVAGEEPADDQAPIVASDQPTEDNEKPAAAPVVNQMTVAPPSFTGVEVKKLGYSLFLNIPDNQLECRCSYFPRNLGSMMTRDELAEHLMQHKVLEGIDQEACESFAIRAATGQMMQGVLLASGTAPVGGSDAAVEITAHPSTAVISGEDDSTDVDMYIVQTFINVEYGEEIGHVIPPGSGTDGRTISGKSIAAEAGKGLKCAIGKNINISDDGVRLTSTIIGRLCQTASEISVAEEYVVKGNVGFKVGVIDFKGFVEVRGDVLDNFDIIASKGLTVTGNIGVCTIVSEGDITVCGMDGQGIGKIVCGGNLHAHFVHDVDIECSGDILVDVEIHNCTIRCLGKVIVEKGAIQGGSCIARGGIEAQKIGSPSSKFTQLIDGMDYHDVEEMERLVTQLSEVQGRIVKSSSKIEIDALRKKTSELSRMIMAIKNKTDAAANAKINAKSTLYENVRLSLGSVTETIFEQKSGPLTIIENSIEGGLRFLSMTGLNVRAADIELALIHEMKASVVAA